MLIQFLEPTRIHKRHAKDRLTIAELARILEAKYQLLEKFTIWVKDRLIDYILETKPSFLEIDRYLESMWRDFILWQFHGIITKKNARILTLYERVFGFSSSGISPERTNFKIPFIETDDYRRSMRMRIKFKPSEIEMLKQIKRFKVRRQ